MAPSPERGGACVCVQAMHPVPPVVVRRALGDLVGRRGGSGGACPSVCRGTRMCVMEGRRPVARLKALKALQGSLEAFFEGL